MIILTLDVYELLLWNTHGDILAIFSPSMSNWLLIKRLCFKTQSEKRDSNVNQHWSDLFIDVFCSEGKTIGFREILIKPFNTSHNDQPSQVQKRQMNSRENRHRCWSANGHHISRESSLSRVCLITSINLAYKKQIQIMCYMFWYSSEYISKAIYTRNVLTSVIMRIFHIQIKLMALLFKLVAFSKAFLELLLQDHW